MVRRYRGSTGESVPTLSSKRDINPEKSGRRVIRRPDVHSPRSERNPDLTVLRVGFRPPTCRAVGVTAQKYSLITARVPVHVTNPTNHTVECRVVLRKGTPRLIGCSSKAS